MNRRDPSRPDGPLRYEALDGLRGAAALLVVLYHVHWASHVRDLTVVRNGYLAVDLFFILSGFVISAAYGSRLGTGVSTSAFLRLRFFRVYPVHIAVLGAMLLLETFKLVAAGYSGRVPDQPPFSGTQSPGALLVNLLLAQPWGILDYLGWNGPSWSIGAEFAAYIAFAALASLGLASSRGVLLPGMLIGLAAYVALAFWAGSLDVTYSFGVLRCLAGFVLGMVVFSLPASRGTGPAFQLAAGILVMALLMWVTGPVSVLAIPAFMALIHSLRTDAGPLARLLRNRTSQYLGLISYSVYMVHFPLSSVVLSVLKRSPDRFGNPWAGDTVTLGYVGATLILAHLSFRVVEEPFRQLGYRLVRSRTHAGQSHAAQKSAST